MKPYRCSYMQTETEGQTMVQEDRNRQPMAGLQADRQTKIQTGRQTDKDAGRQVTAQADREVTCLW